MIRISKKADYAIFLLCYLSRQSDESDSVAPPISAAELADLTGLSHSLVANLLKDYSRAGILDSVRGQHGGYRLARRACDLTLREILSVVEGPINFVECAENQLPGLSTAAMPACGLVPICPSKGPLQVLHNRIVGMLDALTLAEMAQFSTLHGPRALRARPNPGSQLIRQR